MKAKPCCPQLHIWRQIYAVLEEAYLQAGNVGMPAPPLVYNMQTWTYSTNSQKQERWAATRAWAEQYGFEHLIRELSEDEFYDVD